MLIFDVATGKTQFTLRGHAGAVDALVFSPDGTLLASAGQDTSVHIWNPTAGVQLSALTGHSGPIRAISFSSDSRLLATGSEDTNVILWDVRAGRLQKTLSGSPGRINAVVFDPLGRFLASADDAGYITLWSVSTGLRVITIQVPTAPYPPVGKLYSLAARRLGARLKRWNNNPFLAWHGCCCVATTICSAIVAGGPRALCGCVLFLD